MIQLLPCPFCGYTDVAVMIGVKSVKCDRCGALGPLGEDQAMAVDAWNQRYFGAGIPDKNSLSNDILECKTDTTHR